jgi:hypothetical protein
MLIDALLKQWPILILLIVVAIASALVKSSVRSRRRARRIPKREPRVSWTASPPPSEFVYGDDKGEAEVLARRLALERSLTAPGTPRSPPIDTSRWSLELLRALEWKRFEMLCAAYFEALGFKAHVARAGADGGVDVLLYKDDAPKPGIIVQCKAWNTYKVGVKPIRELYGVMARDGVAEGIFVTTGQFTAEARAFPKGNEMHLWDGKDLLSKIKELPSDTKVALLRTATQGDFTTPTCPSCGIKMVPRVSKSDRETFWGCRNYPRCRQTFKMVT